MENRPRFNFDPKRMQAEHEARAYVNHIQFALQLNALLADPSKYSDELKAKAEEAALSVIHASWLGVLPFNFLIELPENNPGRLSKNWEILDERVFRFVASEVCRLDRDQVDFHNIHTDQWLSITKHRVEKITPVFPED